MSTTGTHAFFLNNVPWVIPILDMWLAGETYRFEGDPADPTSIVGFRPAFNWQEDGPSGENGAMVWFSQRSYSADVVELARHPVELAAGLLNAALR